MTILFGIPKDEVNVPAADYYLDHKIRLRYDSFATIFVKGFDGTITHHYIETTLGDNGEVLLYSIGPVIGINK